VRYARLVQKISSASSLDPWFIKYNGLFARRLQNYVGLANSESYKGNPYVPASCHEPDIEAVVHWTIYEPDLVKEN
jgi:hypothetical protein